MRPFAYAQPERIRDLLRLLEEHGPDALMLAGGTDLIVRLRLGHVTPRLVVDVKRVAELSADIIEEPGLLRVGARTVMSRIIGHPALQREFPALVEAARVVGSVQIRHRATLAGNICNASPAADTAPALLVYGARVTLLSRAGTRHVPLTAFFTGPGRTVLRCGEIVQSIDLPRPDGPVGAAFGRVTRRRGVDLATVNACCLVTASGATRFAYGAVGPTPFLVEDESGALAWDRGTAASRAALVDRLIARARPISDVRGGRDYRLAMLRILSRRTLETARRRLARE